MKVITSLKFLKISTLFLLILEISSFFYFEQSLLSLILAIFLGLISLWQFSRNPEIITTLLLYLGLYDLYNIRYGLAVPMAAILVIVLGLTLFLGYLLAKLYQYEEILDKNIALIYLLTSGFIVLEIFLTMSLWPVNPKTKSLVIVIVFYLANKLIYLQANRVLNLKRAAGFVGVSILILTALIGFNWWQGF